MLADLPAASVDCVVTSPPYYGLRDYGHDEQIGLEQSPQAYVQALVEVFREARRVLKDDGVVWINIGDSYGRAPAKGGSGPNGKNKDAWGYRDAQVARQRGGPPSASSTLKGNGHVGGGPKLKTLSPVSKIGSSDGFVGRGDGPGTRAGGDKQLLGIPWRLAFALQDDGWVLRQEIVWHKSNPMPESVADRCTKAHESIFLLAKSSRTLLYRAVDSREWSYSPDLSEKIAKPTTDDPARMVARWRGFDYYFDQDAIAEPSIYAPGETRHVERPGGYYDGKWSERAEDGLRGGSFKAIRETRNKRSVWTVATRPYAEAHFATYPVELIEPCILAGCRPGGVVLDPFGGAGTTALAAAGLGRSAILIEVNPDYAAMAQKRLKASLVAVAGASEADDHSGMPLFAEDRP